MLRDFPSKGEPDQRFFVLERGNAIVDGFSGLSGAQRTEICAALPQENGARGDDLRTFLGEFVNSLK